MTTNKDLLRQFESKILPREKLVAEGIPSASLAILEDGKISGHVISNGNEDTNTVYQACSISKPITALAIAKLVDDGRLSYDAKVADYLPKDILACILEPKTADLIQHVTVSMVCSHSSGLSQSGYPGYESSPAPSIKQILSGDSATNTLKMRFRSFPGAQYAYAGGGYTLLQIILEQICGKPFPDLMQQIVLKPLGMTRSFYGALSPSEDNYTVPHLTGHYRARTGVHCFQELAAAGLWSTPSDLLRAIMHVQKSLLSDKNEGFLKQSTARQMLTSVLDGDTSQSWGRGWALSDLMFSHSGHNYPGYTCFFFGFNDEAPEKLRGSGFAIMTNSNIAAGAFGPIIGSIAYLKGWPHQVKMPSFIGGKKFVPYVAPESTSVDAGWRDWLGRWGEKWSIVEDAGQPAITFKNLPLMKLRPAAAPVQVWDKKEKEEIILVADGLAELAVRLTWDGDEQVVEMLQAEAKLLHRS